jgi:hypothetical protein
VVLGERAWRKDGNDVFREAVGVREDGLGDGEIGASVVHNKIAGLLVNTAMK